ncbi:CHASE2 domain-containing protein [Spirulina major]|uniref:CHASE2 domain-containing protein n=1 Tax=Spirulina major TaxID=270636 RepID=UPI0009327B39|nr:CHASE2 domain-containing protein [Spirulina major]
MKTIRGLVTQYPGFCVATILATGLVLSLRYVGLLQPLEWAAYDTFLQTITPTRSHLDDRIKLVTIDEADLQANGQALISDRALATALRRLAAQQPRVIGLDLYRDLPVPPGHPELKTALRDIPNIVGIQKIGQPTIAPPPILAADGRAKASDFSLDGDNRIRRAYLFLQDAKNQPISGFAAYLALWFLEDEKNIKFTKLSPDRWQLGAATFQRFKAFDGGYVRANAEGFQFLIDYQNPVHPFETIPLREVLAGNLPDDWGRDRIILIGTTAESMNDLFATPFSEFGNTSTPKLMAGVEIHARIIAQLLDVAQGTRHLRKTSPESLEILWIMLWSWLGANFIGPYTRKSTMRTTCTPQQQVQLLGGEVVIIGAWLTLLIGFSYGAFVGGFWIPVVPPLIGFLGAGLGSLIHTANQVKTLRIQNQLLENLAKVDSLTQVANRRSLDDYLKIHWQQAQQQQHQIAVILCDLDYFKQYNDTYGHSAGDDCLQQFAQVLSRLVPNHIGLAARYGGEEFAIVLPYGSRSDVETLTTQIHQHTRQLAIAHSASGVSKTVTVSIGVSHDIPTPKDDLQEFINRADCALYHAKKQGRDRTVFFTNTLA